MAPLQIQRTEHPGWLSNAYLVFDPAERRGVLIDGNGIGEPLLKRVREDDLDIAAILLTHHHADHVDLAPYEELDAPLLAHPETAELAGIKPIDRTLADGELLRTAGLEIEVMHTPGHARDHIAYLVNGTDCFTADLLFRGTVGGTRGPGATSLGDLRQSLDRILELPRDTRLHPGHREPTTVAQELTANPFVVQWKSGATVPRGEPCIVAGEPATLLLWGPDYDGMHKAWVRLADGVEHVVGGSQVVREAQT